MDTHYVKSELLKIVHEFDTVGEITEIIPVKTGHINNSYAVLMSNAESGYFLQQINTRVFKDVAALMKNIELVTNHLKTKLNNRNGWNDFQVLQLIPTLNGTHFFIDAKAEVWRLYKYIQGTHSFAVVTDPEIAREGGTAYGRFFALLDDFPATALSETIPNFHRFQHRYQHYKNALNFNFGNRLKTISREMEFVTKHRSKMQEFDRIVSSGKLRQRISHNDTKFNNILFNIQNKAIAIVDLDTVMPGSVLYDFGDAIRSGTNSSNEDEKNLDLVHFNKPIYEAYTDGFLSEIADKLTVPEVYHLSFSAQYMTFIIGLRFLTDYLNGDVYFKTEYPMHNLVRAQVQFKLLAEMELSQDWMKSLIQNCFEKYC